MAKSDVEVSLNEVAIRLRDSGAFRAALLEVANEKAKGQEIGQVKITGGQKGELGATELAQVVGGAESFNRTVDYSSLVVGGQTSAAARPGALKGFADTTW